MTLRARISDWLATARSLVRPEFALGLFLVPLLLGHQCTPDTEPNDVRTIEDFVECLNHRAVGGDIVDAVQCIPCGCTVTLTKSQGSAQPACNDQGCPMPRILLNCPGPPQLQPSFSLCITSSGLDRVEIGETINTQGHMRMGDVHVDPGYVYLDPSAPVSKVDASGNDTGQCWSCHESHDQAEGEDAISHPEPYEIFGQHCVTDTDEPCQTPDAGLGDCRTEGQLTQESFGEICSCLDAKVNNDLDPLFQDPKLLRASRLCQALMDYRATRGMCGTEECPDPVGPGCHSEGQSCDPYQQGFIVSETTGYTCQEVDGGELQCVSSRECVDYSIAGGGKFLGDDGVSLLRLLITGRAAVDGCPVGDTTDIDAEISAFKHAANTLVNSVQLSSLTATDEGGGNLTLEARGKAAVNGGGPVNVSVDADVNLGTPSFEIRDTDASSSLAGGTGEPGRSQLQLNQTPIP